MSGDLVATAWWTHELYEVVVLEYAFDDGEGNDDESQ
jgi:hypothetical protein